MCKTGGAMPGPDPKLVDLLARRALDWCGSVTGLQVIGLCGAQGSGKSTLVGALASRLERVGLRVAALSLDDLYLTRAERQRLARDVHPLFATRGVPGTHDAALGLATIDALARGEAAPLPRFDKGRDDRLPGAARARGHAGVAARRLVPRRSRSARGRPCPPGQRARSRRGCWRNLESAR